MVVQGDKHTEGGPSTPFCVRVRGPAQPHLLKAMMGGQTVPCGVLWEGHVQRTAPKMCFVSPTGCWAPSGWCPVYIYYIYI